MSIPSFAWIPPFLVIYVHAYLCVGTLLFYRSLVRLCVGTHFSTDLCPHFPTVWMHTDLFHISRQCDCYLDSFVLFFFSYEDLFLNRFTCVLTFLIVTYFPTGANPCCPFMRLLTSDYKLGVYSCDLPFSVYRWIILRVSFRNFHTQSRFTQPALHFSVYRWVILRISFRNLHTRSRFTQPPLHFSVYRWVILRISFRNLLTRSRFTQPPFNFSVYQWVILRISFRNLHTRFHLAQPPLHFSVYRWVILRKSFRNLHTQFHLAQPRAASTPNADRHNTEYQDSRKLLSQFCCVVPW